jgi:hypothetical protein
MNKLLKSLAFPALSMIIVFIIYSGLSISNLEDKTKKLAGENQNVAAANQTILNKILTLENEIYLTKNILTNSENEKENLQVSLASAQKQISSLKSELKNTPVSTKTETKIVTNTVTEVLNNEIEKNEASVIIQNIGSFKIVLQSNDTAFNVLQRASAENGFPLTFNTYSFGVFITSIGNIVPESNQYWAFYYNGIYSNVGASGQAIKQGDTVFWQLESF